MKYLQHLTRNINDGNLPGSRVPSSESRPDNLNQQEKDNKLADASIHTRLAEQGEIHASPTKSSEAETVQDDSFDSYQSFESSFARRKVLLIALLLCCITVITVPLVGIGIFVRQQRVDDDNEKQTVDANANTPSPSQAPTQVPTLASGHTSMPHSGKDELNANDDDDKAYAVSEAPQASPDNGVEDDDGVTDAADTTCDIASVAPAFSGKKGIGMRLVGDELAENLRRIIRLRPYWNYSWGLERVQGQPDDIEFVPMVWGGAREPAELASQLEDVFESGKVKRILSFNEPDREDQANMPVWQVTKQWSSLTAAKLPIIGPSCFKPTGNWMKTFFKRAEENCHRVDYVGVHWYGNANAGQFKRLMREIYAMYQRPLVITEFAPADWSASSLADNRFSADEVLAFAKEVIPWLESVDWVAAYAWFPFKIDAPVGTSSALFYDGGDMTALGRYYSSVSSENPNGDQWIKTYY